MDKGWLILFIAGINEIIWATAMDYSDGFRIWYYDIAVFIFLAISMYLLEKAISSGIPVGTGYAVWTGIGAIGTIVISVLGGHETLTALRALFVVMIIAGIAGLQVTAGSSEKSEE